MPSPERGVARLLGRTALQIWIAVPPLKDGGERVDISGFVERRRYAEIRCQTRLSRRRREQNGNPGSQIREDLVAKTEAMVEDRSVLRRDTEVVTLREFDH